MTDWEVLYGKIQNLNHLFILNSKKKKAKEVGKIAIKIKQKKYDMRWSLICWTRNSDSVSLSQYEWKKPHNFLKVRHATQMTFFYLY